MMKRFTWWKLTVIENDKVVDIITSTDINVIIKEEAEIKKFKSPENTEFKIKNYKFEEEVIDHKMDGYDLFVRNYKGDLYAANVKEDGSLRLLKVDRDELY